MKRFTLLVAATALVLTMAPGASHAGHCPGLGQSPAPPKSGGANPAQDDIPLKSAYLFIESGTLPPSYPTVDYTSFQNLGKAGCWSEHLEGIVNTNYLTPNANALQVVAYNYPSDPDSTPAPGCLRFNGAPASNCVGSGNIKLNWNLQSGSPIHRDGPRFVSQIVTIPATATSVTATATIVLRPTAPNTTKLTTTYTKFCPQTGTCL